MTGNVNFPNPTMDLTLLGTALTIYAALIAAALDGSKSAKSAREKQKKVVVKDLRQLAMYVESNCNDDVAIFTTSGFSAKAKPSASAPVGIPTISLDYGAHPGQLLVSIKASAGARSYNVRFAPLAGTVPGAMDHSQHRQYQEGDQHRQSQFGHGLRVPGSGPGHAGPLALDGFQHDHVSVAWEATAAADYANCAN